MYLRTGSAGPTQPRGPRAVSRPRGVGSAARIVGRRRLRELRDVGYVFGVRVTFCATTTGSPPKVGNFQRIAAVWKHDVMSASNDGLTLTSFTAPVGLTVNSTTSASPAWYWSAEFRLSARS